MEKNRAMKKERDILPLMTYLAVCVAQLFMTRLLPYLGSKLFPALEIPQGTISIPYMAVNGVLAIIGVFITGWLAIQVHLLRVEPRLLFRLLGTVTGMALPILLGIIFASSANLSGIFFSFAAPLCVVGFHLPNLIRANQGE
jgi:hypothetical protein